MASIAPTEVFSFGTVELFGIKLSLSITEVVITTWVAIALCVAFAVFFTRKLSLENPSLRQLFIETVIVAIAKQIREFSGMPVAVFFNFIATLWLFVAFSNLVGMIPPFSTPTSDLNAVAGLSTVVFFSTYYYGVKFYGISFLKRFIEPNPVLLPLNIVGEVGRILSLTIRLFGNMLGWDLIIAMLVLLTGIIVPVPLMLFNVLGDLIQAYLYGALTLVYIVAGLKVEEIDRKLANLYEDWYQL
jgi:F-type H+-transporting ATPase subunit a